MRRTVATLLTLLVVGACGGGGGGDAAPEPAGATTTTTADPADAVDNDVACQHLGRVHQMDQEVGRAVDSAVAHFEAGVGDEATVIASINESAAQIAAGAAEVDAAYAAAAAAARDDVAADIQTLAEASRAITPTIVEVLGSAQTFDDLARMETALSAPDILAATRTAAAATLSLDRYTETLCGFTLSD